jgi:predicted HTH domain antitoxin
MTTTLTLELPEGFEFNDEALKMILAIRLYEGGQCSLGQAATVAGISKRAFIETMGMFGGSVFSGYTVDDLTHDLKYA